MSKKQKRSAEIMAEIQNTNARLEELRPNLDSRADKLRKIEKEFLEKSVTFEEFQATQIDHDLLERSVNSLMSNLDRLHIQYQDALRSEGRQETLTDMKRSISEGRERLSSYFQLREKMDALTQELSDAMTSFQASQIRFQSHFRELCPGVDNLRVIPKHNRAEFEAIRGELALAGISDDDFRFAIERPTTPALKHTRAIDALERVAEGERMADLQRERDRIRQESVSRAGEIRLRNEEAYRETQKARVTEQQQWRSRESNFKNQQAEKATKERVTLEAA